MSLAQVPVPIRFGTFPDCTLLIFDTFNVEAYTKSARGPMRAELRGVDSNSADETQRMLWLLGHHLQATQAWMARVLVTHTHKDARITAFLTTWAYEQHWLGDALLALSGHTPDRSYSTHEKHSSSRSTLWAATIANLHGRALMGVQMTERLIENWLTDAMLAKVQQGAPSEVAEDLAAIRITLARQAQFFAAEAERELRNSKSAQRLTRSRLMRNSWPLNAGRIERKELSHLLGADVASELDTQIDELPGLAGLNLMRKLAADR